MQLSADLFIEPLAPLNKQQKLLCSGIKKHVQMLAGDIGARSLTSAPKGLEDAANYIEHVLQQIGFSFTRQEFKAEVYNTNARQQMPATIHTTRNIIAELKGSKRPNEILIIGAHYDTEYLSRGANDNASGIAALLEIAKAMRNSDKSERTIRFVAFSNEEQ
ncbi:MAG: M28 family peptidase, partial [Candidatus Obscuribacterales bacterium]|nr:M28 family peptidase [Candidatus Obscuribacterales bacterium]